MSDKPTGLALLRVPFPANQISKLPKPTVKKEEWYKLPKAMCRECGAYHATSKTIHLSYVGHAALTDRLLDADPEWNWEPCAVAEDGSPKLDSNGGMWIRLSVCGVTRLGYGDAQDKEGANAVKERIGDALRNAAMRFGAALELWHKGELHVENGEEEDSGNKLIGQIIAANVKPMADAKKNVDPEEQKAVEQVVKDVKQWLKDGSLADAATVIDETILSQEAWVYFWTFFESKDRAALKEEGKAIRKRALQREEASQA